MEDTLFNNYERLCITQSDINEHLPTLLKYARESDKVTEFGVRTWVSTAALLMWCDNVTAYDIMKYFEVVRLEELAKKEWKNFKFIEWDTRIIEIEETDFLFIDTFHIYDLLKVELERHSWKVNKWIAMHDTATFGERWEDPQYKWLMPAIEEFLAEHKQWVLKETFFNNNWLSILERISDDDKTIDTDTVSS